MGQWLCPHSPVAFETPFSRAGSRGALPQLVLPRAFAHSSYAQGSCLWAGVGGGGAGELPGGTGEALSGRGAGIGDLLPGWWRWAWSPGGPAPPGLWREPAVPPLGSRGQRPEADGRRSAAQAAPPSVACSGSELEGDGPLPIPRTSLD